MFSKIKLAATAALISLVLTGPALAIQGSDVAGAQEIVDQSAHVVQSLSSNHDFMKLLENARGVFIVPSLVRGAFLMGASGGKGLLVAHEGGRWRGPAFLTIGSISLGLQAGWEGGPVILFLMTDRALADFTHQNNISLEGDAYLTVYTWSPAVQWPITNGDVLLWSGENGIFAGLDFKGSDVHDDTIYDKAYYDNKYTETKKILEDGFSPEAGNLLAVLPPKAPDSRRAGGP